MSVFRTASGTVTVEITSANIPGLLEVLCKNEIFLWGVSYRDDLTATLRIRRASYRKVRSILERRGDSCRVVSREGVYWDLAALVKRPVLLLGLAMFLFVMFYIPSRVFFVSVEGNSLIASNAIMSAASDLGVKFGASRRLVKSEQVKNGLLSALDGLEWAGVNTKGCVAIVSVRERPLEEGGTEVQGVGNVVAFRDGVILSCDVTQGTALCTPGQAVKAGDLLISGTIDHGYTTVSTLAEGEVFASTQRKFSMLTSGEITKRGDMTWRKERYSLLVGKKLINFFKCSGISGATCVKMNSKYVLTLPGGFRLPVALVKQSYVNRELSDACMDESQARQLLSDASDRYILDRMIAGRILSTSKAFSSLGEGYHLTGIYACTEMIGRVQQEQIGAYNGKTD